MIFLSANAMQQKKSTIHWCLLCFHEKHHS